MTDPRRLAIVVDYASLVDGLMARKAELGMSNATLDEIAGLTPGHAGKLLAPASPKVLGQMSFGLMLQALGLKVWLVEDEEATARLRSRYSPRNASRAHEGVPKQASIRRVMREVGKRGNAARHAKLSAETRREIAAIAGSAGGRATAAKLTRNQRRVLARRLANARWAKRKAEDATTPAPPADRSEAEA